MRAPPPRPITKNFKRSQAPAPSCISSTSGTWAAPTLLLAAVKGAGKAVCPLDATSPRGKNALMAAMNAVVSEKAQRLKEKGMARPLRFLVAGVPNTGKSTVINLLSGAKRAVTGDKAGVTRSKQWVKCGAFDLMDTPGTMPPSFADQTLARRLAYIGSVNDDILELDEIALALLEDLSALAPAALSERYGIEGGTPLQMLEQVCIRRGFLLKGDEYDYERGERALIDDFRKGKLGRHHLRQRGRPQKRGARLRRQRNNG